MTDSILDDRKRFAFLLRILRDGSYKMARFLDVFFELSPRHQDAFVAFAQAKIGDERWAKAAKDRYQYPEFIKALLMHHSGKQALSQPTFDDLMMTIAEYVKSPKFSEVQGTPDETEGSFMDFLQEDF